MGKRPICEIKPPEVLEVLRKIEGRGAAETARRMKIVCGQVFRYAVATGRARRDPTPDLKGALKTPVTTHMAEITDPKEAGALLRAIWDYKGLKRNVVVDFNAKGSYIDKSLSNAASEGR